MAVDEVALNPLAQNVVDGVPIDRLAPAMIQVFAPVPQIRALGMVYCRCNEDGTYKSSVDKFYDQEDLSKWAAATGAKPGDLISVLSGETHKVLTQLSALRM